MPLAPTRSSWVLFALCIVFLQRAAVAAATDPPLMRYRFEAGKAYQYNFAYQLKSCEGLQASNGARIVQCEAAGSEEFTIRSQNAELIPHHPANVNHLTILHNPLSRDAPDVVIPQFDGPVVRDAAAGPAPNVNPTARVRGSTFTRTGELIAAATTQRPSSFLLGYNCQFAIEALPESPAKSWTKTSRRTLRVNTSGATCPAKEEAKYTVVAVKGDMVFLTKNYLLRSDPYDNGTTRLTMNGCGSLALNVKLGAFRMAAMNYVISIAHSGKVEAVAISLNYILGEPVQVAAAPKPQPGVAAQPSPPPAKPHEPLTAEARREILRDLKSTTGQTVRNASLRLIAAKVDDQPAEISAALAGAMKGLNDWDRAAVLERPGDLGYRELRRSPGRGRDEQYLLRPRQGDRAIGQEVQGPCRHRRRYQGL